MTFKTFTFRNGFGSWGRDEGHCATLIGGFYDYETPKTFRKIKVVKLVEKTPTNIKDDHWYIQTDAGTIQRALKLVKHDPQWQSPALIIEGNNRSVNDITPYMGSSGG